MNAYRVIVTYTELAEHAAVELVEAARYELVGAGSGSTQTWVRFYAVDGTEVTTLNGDRVVSISPIDEDEAGPQLTGAYY